MLCDVGEAHTLRKKESFEIFINSRDTFVHIPVDEDQVVLVPDPSPVSKILNIHVDPYKSTFLRTTDTSLREEVTTHTNTELLTGLKQLWRRFLTIFKMKLLVSYISKVTVVQLRSLVMTLAVFMMAINKKTGEEQDRSF